MSSFYEDTRKRLVRIAQMKARKFPQYRGRYETWWLGQMLDHETGHKSGVVLAKDQFVLFNPVTDNAYVTAYDPTLDYDVGVLRTKIKTVMTYLPPEQNVVEKRKPLFLGR